MTTALDLPRLTAEQALCRQSFAAFLKFVRIEDPPPTGAGIVPFQLWPHLVEAAQVISEANLVVWLKSKQIGASWLVAAYAVHLGSFSPPALVLNLSQGELYSTELLRKGLVVHDNLPLHLRAPLVRQNLESVHFRNGSRILALPSTKAAGIGFTASVVIMDEADFHEQFDANYEDVKPTIDAGGKLIILSTANPETQTSGFKRLWQGAPANGFRPIFMPWRVRPGRTQAWYDAGLAASLDPEAFRKNYPGSSEEALEPSQAVAAFDLGALKAMQQDVKAPVSTLGLANLYQLPAVGKRYAAGTDSSHGVGADYSVTAVVDTQTGYVVADILNNLIPPDELAQVSYDLLKMYRFPLWAIEDNEWGILTLSKARELGYPLLFHRDNDAKKPLGWHTDEKSRYTLWGELIEAVKQRLVTVPNEKGLGQMFGVIRDAKHGGKIQAREGGNDDYPTALGIAWQMRKYVPMGATREVQVGYIRRGE